MYRPTWGFLELNSRIKAIFVDGRDVKICLFQRAEHKESRESTMTEDTLNSLPPTHQKKSHITLSK